MSAPLVNRSLANLKTELEFLRDSNVVTEAFYNQIVSALPERYQNGAAPIDAIGGGESTAARGSSASESDSTEYAEALYEYKAEQAEDLALKVGDKVQVIQHVSNDWWKGSINGKTGMFPAVYVRVLGSAGNSGRAPAPASRPVSEAQAPAQGQQQLYPQSSYASSQQSFAPPPTYQQPPQPLQQFYQPQQQPQQAVQEQPQQQQQQQQQHHHGGQMFKKFGSQLGNAAIFGAGASIGSDIVNSIF